MSLVVSRITTRYVARCMTCQYETQGVETTGRSEDAIDKLAKDHGWKVKGIDVECPKCSEKANQ